MPRKWKGDDTHRLPAQQVEPYRLWFEFLKLAAKDPDVQLDRHLYRAWGDFENQKFSEWWSEHWRSLFALDIGVRLIVDPAEVLAEGDQCLIVRLPLYQAKQKTLRLAHPDPRAHSRFLAQQRALMPWNYQS